MRSVTPAAIARDIWMLRSRREKWYKVIHSATAAQWFSHFLLKALGNRCVPIRTPMVWRSTIEVRIPSGPGEPLAGYPDANDAGRTTRQQAHRPRLELPARGLARAGITTLVNGATGYQGVREHNALERILDRFIRELARRVRTFPQGFYEQVFHCEIGHLNLVLTRRPML
jgi:hypothetical protein